jgi:hypothetical protein
MERAHPSVQGGRVEVALVGLDVRQLWHRSWSLVRFLNAAASRFVPFAQQSPGVAMACSEEMIEQHVLTPGRREV